MSPADEEPEQPGPLYALFRIRREERASFGLAFGAFFCLLFCWYLVRPVREAMGTLGDVYTLSWLFYGTFGATLITAALFGWLASRAERRRVVGYTYGACALCLVGFSLGFAALGSDHVPLARVFFVWASVFGFLIPSVFWSVQADLFRSPDGRRLFGVIASGGTCGMLVASLLTRRLAETLGTPLLLLLPIPFLGLAVLFMALLRRRHQELKAEAPEVRKRALGGTLWAGATTTARIPYFRGIALFLFLQAAVGTAFYFQQRGIVKGAFLSTEARTSWFANLNAWVSGITLGLQALATSRLVQRFGLSKTLAILPSVCALGLLILGAFPALAVLAALQVTRRSTSYGVKTPSLQLLYTVVTPEEKYKTKNFLDLVVVRGSDALASSTYTALVGLGLSSGGIAFCFVLPCGLWLAVAAWLGREHGRRVGTHPA